MTNGARSDARSLRVVLHVGIQKTGSSYIQSSLALSRTSLAASGILYPEHESDPAAVAGHVTSGNIDVSDAAHLREVILREVKNAPPTVHTILYSNEMLARVLSENPQVLRDVVAVVPVDVVAFIRDPAEWFISNYGQHVKGKGLTEGVYEFIPQWMPPRVAAEFFKLCEARGVGLRVRNYSKTKGDLLGVFAKMVSPVDELSLTLPSRTVVNRSLTVSEEALQRELNKTDFANPELLADALVNQVPEVRVEPRPMPPELVALLEENFSDVFVDLARYLPDDEAPVFESNSAGTNSLAVTRSEAEYSFSQDQLEVIVASLVRASHLHQSASTSNTAGDLEARLNELQAEVDALRASRSWRYTRFLRRKM